MTEKNIFFSNTATNKNINRTQNEAKYFDCVYVFLLVFLLGTLVSPTPPNNQPLYEKVPAEGRGKKIEGLFTN